MDINKALKACGFRGVCLGIEEYYGTKTVMRSTFKILDLDNQQEMAFNMGSNRGMDLSLSPRRIS